MTDAPSIPTPVMPPNLDRVILGPFENAIAAGAREALKLGVPAHRVIEMHLNHLASVVAALEPPAVRVDAIESIVAQFAGLVRQHVDARKTTAGGIRIPDSARVPNGG